jgi:putative aldouronate transport system permease protein
MQKVQFYPIMTYIQSLTIDIGAIMEQGGTMDESLLDMLSKLGNKNLNCAKIVIAIIPLLMIYPLCQRYLISGMVMGSVKE